MNKCKNYLLRIHICSSFIHHQNFIIPDDCTRQTNQLSLSRAEIRTTFSYRMVQTRHCFFQLNLYNKNNVAIISSYKLKN